MYICFHGLLILSFSKVKDDFEGFDDGDDDLFLDDEAADMVQAVEAAYSIKVH